MRYIEILLKVLFIVGAAVFFVWQDYFLTYFSSFLLVALFLGITLLFNKKKQSYGYQLSKREIVIRAIEGGLLVAFAIVFGFIKLKGII